MKTKKDNRSYLEPISKIPSAASSILGTLASFSTKNVLSVPLGTPPRIFCLRPRHCTQNQTLATKVFLRCVLIALGSILAFNCLVPSKAADIPEQAKFCSFITLATDEETDYSKKNRFYITNYNVLFSCNGNPEQLLFGKDEFKVQYEHKRMAKKRRLEKVLLRGSKNFGARSMTSLALERFDKKGFEVISCSSSTSDVSVSVGAINKGTQCNLIRK